MPPVRYCTSGDGQEAAPRRQVCYECWLAKQPPVVRAEAAKARLALIPVQYRIARIHKSKWPEGRRWCAGCQTMVRIKDSGASKCKACASISSHASAVKGRFGLDDASYQWLLDLQKGRCAICRAAPKTTRLAVDHDHGHEACQGKGCRECVRGLICSKCNHEVLGGAHDSIHIIANAWHYLRTPPMGGEWDIPTPERDAYEAEHGLGAEPPPF